MKLHISKDLALPMEAVTESIAMLGRKGSGKSYLAHLLAEEMYRCKVQFVGLDPVGIWYGLRLAADGKRPGLPIPVLGGLHGDIPLEASGGALVADLVVDRGVSMILDVSQFESDADKARFAQAFADRFFFRKKAVPSPVHVFIEECQEFVPQNPQREEARMLHAFTRMAKIGRNFGIGLSLISQRPQEVNKKVLNLTELLFAFQLTGPQERKTIQGWISEKGIDEDIAGELPKLKVGEPHVWSPAWLQISRVVKIAQKDTFDVSTTPKVGKQVAARDLSPIDLDRLRTDMAATIEKAKADDPKLLRARIFALERDLKKGHPAPAGKPAAVPAKATGPRREDIATINALRKALEEAMKFIIEINAKDFIGTTAKPANAQIEKAITEATQTVKKMIERHLDQRNKELDALRLQGQRVINRLKGLLDDDVTIKVDVRHNEPFTVSPSASARAPRMVSGPGTDLPPAERKFLTALAQQARPLTRNQVAIFAGYSTASGHVDNTLGALRAAGYAVGGRDGITITDAGLAALGTFDPLPTGEDLRAYWIRELEPAASKFLAVLCEIYPSTIERDELATRAGYSPQSGHVDNTLGRLRSLELATGGRASIKASENLFG